MNRLVLLFITSLFFFASAISAQPNPASYTAQKKAMGSKAAVASAHPLASKVGIDILKQGGNAYDAAIAMQFVLAVVYPGAGNLGGGGFLVSAGTGKPFVLDYREIAPAKAHRDMYLDSNGQPIKGLSTSTRLASGVPGTVAGIFATLPYAKFTIRRLIAPAIKYAEQGFAITDSQASSLNSYRTNFIALNRKPVAFVKDVPWKAGDLLVQKELAQTLRRIEVQGIRGFYEGRTAQFIVDEMERGNGIISLQDLAGYKAVKRAPYRFRFKHLEIITVGLPSSGGLILEQLLKMTSNRGLSSFGFLSPMAVQLMVEAERRSFADRAAYMGDADYVRVPMEKLRDTSYLRERMNDFVPGKAGSSMVTGHGLVPESLETTHISIVDAAGNAVAVTTTLNDSYGNKVVVEGAGFLMNNEMDDFSIKPGVPNIYGAIGSDANAIAPRKRMLSSMTPVIILKNNLPHVVMGTPGGTSIPTSIFQTIINLFEFNMSPADAVNKPKFHHQWLPDEVSIESAFPQNTAAALEAMGYTLKTIAGGYIGRMELIRIDQHPRRVEAIADFRGDDDAKAY